MWISEENTRIDETERNKQTHEGEWVGGKGLSGE
jgi:hypothetical protein